MPTYQQRFGHAPPPKKKPPVKSGGRAHPRPEVQAGIEAHHIARQHGSPAAHQFLARQNVHQPPPRSKASAQREAGIVHLRQEPREARIGQQPSRHQTAINMHREALRLYHQGDRQQAIKLNASARKLVGLDATGYAPDQFGALKAVTGIDVSRLAHPQRTVERAQAQTGLSIGIVPGGGRIGKLFGRTPKYETIIGKPSDAPVVGAGAVPKPPGQVVREALPGARRKYAEQKGLRREELGQRVGRAEQAQAEAGGGVAGMRAGLRELKGPLPATTFENLRKGTVSESDIEQLSRQIQNHPGLQYFEGVSGVRALHDAFQHGRTPAPHEIAILHRVFGEEATQHMLSLHARLGQKAIDALNIPRSLMASVDVSAPFRQGLVAGAGHPRIFAKNIGPMFKALGSERVYKGILDEIHSRPNAPLYESSGLKFTELRGATAKLREEQFSSDMAEHIPLLGHVVRASGRAYTGFLDKMRADMFDSMLATAAKKGVNVENPKFLRSVARYSNSATGRGSLGPVESWAPALNTIFFSPRLIASRVNFLDPTWYFRLDPFARKQALKSILTLGSGAGAGLALAGEFVNAKVGKDPRSSDFAKLRFGNTRVDVLGGFQQYVRLASQLEQGKIVSSTTGRTLQLGPGFGHMTRKDILERFAVGKFAPPASFVYDFFKGTTYNGQPFEIKQALLSRIIPLVAQDAYDLQKDRGSAPLTAAGYLAAATGIGIQTYGNQSVAKAKAKLSTATSEQNLHLEHLVKKGVLPKPDVPELRKALDLYNKRNAANLKIEQEVDTAHPRAREQQKLAALLRLLHSNGLLSTSKYREYKDHYQRKLLSAEELRRDRDWFWRTTAGPTISWYHDKAGANN